jgi:hypothetical protein
MLVPLGQQRLVCLHQHRAGVCRILSEMPPVIDLPGAGGVIVQSALMACQGTYSRERNRNNLLFVHYNDLKSDLEGEMRWMAAFLDIEVAGPYWPVLVEAASFETMKRQGDKLMPIADTMFTGGRDRFFNRGQYGRWRDIFRVEDLATYDAKLAAALPQACITWLEGGRRSSGDPARILD